MLKKLIRWYSNRRKPNHVTREYYSWTLFHLKWFHVMLVAQVRSDEREQNWHVQHNWLLLLDGDMVMHFESDELLPRSVYEDYYTYVGDDGRTMRALTLEPHDGFFAHARDPFKIELQPARNFGEQIFDMPRWMNAHDVRTDTERHCWFLRVQWKCRR